jgi:NADH:ubiquinone reductase (non-electrogenic)
MQLTSLSRRSLSTRSPVQALRSSRNSQQTIQRTARRAYADAAPAPAPKPRRRFRFLRWTWRLTLLAGVGLAGNLAYNIYDQRHPIEQFVPDPSKKTLVILGKFKYFRFCSLALEHRRTQLTINRMSRYWMGLRFSSQEA